MGDPVFFSGAETGNYTLGNTGVADSFNGLQGDAGQTAAQIAAAFQVTNEITARVGTYCFRTHYDSDWGYNAGGPPAFKYRSEFNQPGGANKCRWYDGDTMRLGFSTYLPNDTDHQNMIQTTKQNSTLWQVVSSPPSAGIWGMNMREGQFELGCGNVSRRFIGDIVLGVWDDWVYDVKWSTGADGYVKVYRNGTLVLSGAGRNMQEAADYIYFKFGVYRNSFGIPGEDTTTGPFTQLKQYYDEIRIGNATNTLAEVTPGQGNTPVEPTPGLTYRNDGDLPPDVEFFPSTGIYEGNPSVDGVYSMQTTALNDDGEVTDSWTWTVEAPAVTPDTEREFYMKFPDGTFKRLGLVPPGGTIGQGLAKASGSDYDVEWTTGAGGGFAHDLNYHTDVTLTTLINDQVMTWNGTEWVNVNLPLLEHGIGDHIDVNINAPVDGQIMEYLNGQWVNVDAPDPVSGGGNKVYSSETVPPSWKEGDFWHKLAQGSTILTPDVTGVWGANTADVTLNDLTVAVASSTSGQRMVLIVMIRGSTDETITVPAGFTPVYTSFTAGEGKAVIYTGTVLGGTYNIPISVSPDRRYAAMAVAIENSAGPVIASTPNGFADVASVQSGPESATKQPAVALSILLVKNQQNWAGTGLAQITLPAGWTQEGFEKAELNACPLIAVASLALTDLNAIDPTWSTSDTGEFTDSATIILEGSNS